VPDVAVFYIYFMCFFLGTLLRYFLNYFGIAPVVPCFTGITVAVTFHVRNISVVRSSYFKNCHFFLDRISFF
jgi:hypothetical protein